MGKGYNNYMCKKPFHPGSKANIKRAWMAEQKTDSDKKKQDDLKLQYEKEQELYNNKALLSKESKDKIGLNFMYEAPPGAKKERQREDNEPEYKFEWQRKYNAPREDFAKGNQDIRDQPFGIQVRNVRCIKCHKWGHINTDKECPMFNKAATSEAGGTSMDPLQLMDQMKEEEGLALKESILGRHVKSDEANQQLITSDNEEEDVEMEFLKSLSTKQKQKLLRKLERIERGKGKKKKRSKDKSKKRKRKESLSSDGDERSKRKRRHRHDSAVSSSDSRDDRHKTRSRQRRDSASSNDSDATGHDTKSRHSRKRASKSKHRRRDDSSSSSASESGAKQRKKQRRRKHESTSSSSSDAGKRHANKRQNRKRHRSSSSSDSDEREGHGGKRKRETSRDSGRKHSRK